MCSIFFIVVVVVVAAGGAVIGVTTFTFNQYQSSAKITFPPWSATYNEGRSYTRYSDNEVQSTVST